MIMQSSEIEKLNSLAKTLAKTMQCSYKRDLRVQKVKIKIAACQEEIPCQQCHFSIPQNRAVGVQEIVNTPRTVSSLFSNLRNRKIKYSDWKSLVEAAAP